MPLFMATSLGGIDNVKVNVSSVNYKLVSLSRGSKQTKNKRRERRSTSC